MQSVETCRIEGFKNPIDYNQLNANIARWFENPDLVEGAKTRAIVVLYKVSGTPCAVPLAMHHTQLLKIYSPPSREC